MIHAPKITLANQAMIALMFVTLALAYYTSGAVQSITALKVDNEQLCTFLASRTVDQEDYYSQGVTIYSNFARGWRSHGYFDIATDWESLANRDRLRVQQLHLGRYVEHCSDTAPTPSMSLQPMPFPPLATSLPNLPKATP